VLRPTRPSRRTAALTGAAVLGVSGALVLGIGLQGGAAGHLTSRPVESTAPTPAAPSSAPASAEAPLPTLEARYTPASEIHLEIESVGLDLPLLPMTPKNGVINPKLLTAAYWIEPYGQPTASADQAQNTLYIAAHSAGRGEDGFDPLLTGDHKGSALAAGDVVRVRTPGGTVAYTVERTQRYGKNELPAAEEVWESEPGRLVLITCFQRADGRNSTENLVVFAEA
jgi:sortase (surface protein transpeptidase)